MHHVAIFDDVILAFQTPLAGFLGAALTLVLDEIVIGHDFGTDEAFLEVGVDHPGRLWGGGAYAHGPGTYFLHAGREVGLQVQQLVTGTDYTVQARFFQAQGLEEHVLFLTVVQLGDFRFDLVAHRYDHSAFFFGDGLHYVQVRVALETVLGDVGDVHHRLAGQQVEAADQGLFVGAHVLHQAARWLAFGEVRDQLFQNGLLRQGFLVATLGVAGHFLQLLFAAVEVGKDQFEVDDLDVALGIDAVGNVNHVLVFEAAHHVGDGVGFADVGEELVAQAFAFRSTGHQACNVDEFHGGGQNAVGLDDFSQRIEARIGHGHDTAVRLDGAEREVLCRDARLGQGVEQGGLADVGQADDAAIETHGYSPL